MIAAGLANLLDTLRRDTPRGRDYSDPIDVMVRAIPPDCKHTPADIIEALHERGYRVVLVEASILRIMEQIAQKRDQSALAVGGEVR